MNQNFEVFDWHRILVGEAPLIFLLEIIFRTVIMYCYTIFLLRILGKRGIGQFSILEVSIIICFGSAIGDPMIDGGVPILHGIVAVTAIALLQVGLEKFINKNKTMEQIMEGSPGLIVENGMIQLDRLKEDNLSKQDLFRSLRSKDVSHLGEVSKAFFETSGDISVLLHSEEKIKPGLTVVPEEEISSELILKARENAAKDAGQYCCMNCGNVRSYKKNTPLAPCTVCNGEHWIKAVME